MSRESDEYIYGTNILHSQLYIDAHLCKIECGVFGNKHLDTNKGIIYLALINYPYTYPFLQADGYHTEKGYPAKKCNQCDGSIELVRQLSIIDKRNCRDCKDIFEIETVSWSTHSFTVIDDELVRDRYFYQCPSHYGPQDQSMMFV